MLALSFSWAGEIILPLRGPALPTHTVIRLHQLHHSRTGSKVGGNGRRRTKRRVSPEPVYMLLRCLSACAHTTRPLTGAACRMRNRHQLSHYDFISQDQSQTQITPSPENKEGLMQLIQLGYGSDGVFSSTSLLCLFYKTGGFPFFLTVSDSLLRPLVMNVNPWVSMATPVFCMCSSTYLKMKSTFLKCHSIAICIQQSIIHTTGKTIRAQSASICPCGVPGNLLMFLIQNILVSKQCCPGNNLKHMKSQSSSKSPIVMETPCHAHFNTSQPWRNGDVESGFS